MILVCVVSESPEFICIVVDRLAKDNGCSTRVADGLENAFDIFDGLWGFVFEDNSAQDEGC